MIPESEVPFEVRSVAHLASMEIGEWVVDRRLKHPREIVADAIMADRASRLTRQEDETRRAALEEALSCAKAWRFVPAEFIVPAAMTAEELVIAQRTAKGIEDAIRDLMEAGHGVR